MIVLSSGDGCRGFEDVIMDEVKYHNYHNSYESHCSPAMNKAFKGIDDVNPKVDDLKREFAKKEGETLTLSYKINVRILGDFLRSIPALPIIIVGFIIAIKIFHDHGHHKTRCWC